MSPSRQRWRRSAAVVVPPQQGLHVPVETPKVGLPRDRVRQRNVCCMRRPLHMHPDAHRRQPQQNKRCDRLSEAVPPRDVSLQTQVTRFAGDRHAVNAPVAYPAMALPPALRVHPSCPPLVLEDANLPRHVPSQTARREPPPPSTSSPASPSPSSSAHISPSRSTAVTPGMSARRASAFAAASPPPAAAHVAVAIRRARSSTMRVQPAAARPPRARCWHPSSQSARRVKTRPSAAARATAARRAGRPSSGKFPTVGAAGAAATTAATATAVAARPARPTLAWHLMMKGGTWRVVQRGWGGGTPRDATRRA